MTRFKSYRFELLPNGLQARKMRQFAGSCRFVYNRAVAERLEGVYKEVLDAH
jgi:putative transposase